MKMDYVSTFVLLGAMVEMPYKRNRYSELNEPILKGASITKMRKATEDGFNKKATLTELVQNGNVRKAAIYSFSIKANVVDDKALFLLGVYLARIDRCSFISAIQRFDVPSELRTKVFNRLKNLGAPLNTESEISTYLVSQLETPYIRDFEINFEIKQ